MDYLIVIGNKKCKYCDSGGGRKH